MGTRVLSPCGTYGAYQRHVKRGEKPCAPCTEAHRVYMDEWHLKNPDKRAEYDADRAPHKPPTPAQSRGYRVRYRYGLSPDEQVAKFEAQGRRCACCTTDKTQGREKPWQIDHNHDTNMLRGTICARCNRTIAQAGDNAICVAVTLSRFLAYLHKYDDTLSEANTEALIGAIRNHTECVLPGSEGVHPDRPIRPQHAEDPPLGRQTVRGPRKLRDQRKPPA